MLADNIMQFDNLLSDNNISADNMFFELTTCYKLITLLFAVVGTSMYQFRRKFV
jgi:hypothetical protein